MGKIVCKINIKQKDLKLNNYLYVVHTQPDPQKIIVTNNSRQNKTKKY